MMKARLRRLVVWSALIVVFNVGADVEGDRYPLAKRAMPDLAGAVESLLSGDQEMLGDASSEADCQAFGQLLWERATEGVPTDDRGLYWARLAALQHLTPSSNAPQDMALHQNCRTSFEAASRGRAELSWKEGHYRLLVSGFDPFLLDRNIEQSNPSGLAALRLDDQVLESSVGTLIHVRAVIFPVRFGDFDQGTLESLLGPLIEDDRIDAFVSISMGRDAFDLERFPGRRRSASSPDNLNLLSGGSEKAPIVPELGGVELEGPEFLEFSLPVERMQSRVGRWPVRDNHEITTLERGTLNAESLAALADQVAVRGSGGGYLSNEIAYRALNVMRQAGRVIPMGHIHTPRMTTFDPTFLDDVVQQVEAMLQEIP
jgi:pyrrolidone-carboxylate peptidase